MTRKGAKAGPPRLARALLRWVVRREDGDRIVRELDELWTFRLDSGRGGRLWYWRQTLGFVVRMRAYRPSRRSGSFDWLLSWRSDLRFTLRRLIRRPTAALLIAGTLGTVIGVHSAVFAAVDAVLLAPLPYSDAEQLWQLWTEDPQDPEEGSYLTSRAAIRSWSEGATPFERFGYSVQATATLTEMGAPELVQVQSISEDLLDLLGVSPTLGRGFSPEEHASSSASVLLLSHAFWSARFDRDPDVVGETVRLNGASMAVVGVMPAGFRFPMETDVLGWMPLWSDEGEGFLFEWPLFELIGRTALELEPEQVVASLAPLMPVVSEETFADAVPRAVRVDRKARPDDRGLLALLGVVSLVTLLAALNVSEFLIASGTERRPELAVRRALGAGAARIRRLVATEALLLAGAGAVVATLVSVLLVDWFSGLNPGALPGWADMRPTPRTLLFTFGSAFLAALAMGVVPTLRSGREARPSEVAMGARTRRDSRWISLLLGLQTAVAVVVITGGILLYRGWADVMASNPGFEPADAVVGMIYLPQGRYNPGDGAAHTQYFEAFRERLSARPGIRSVAVATALPTAAGLDFSQNVRLEGLTETQARPIEFRLISTDYFETVGSTVVAGRAPDGRDTGETENVVVLNRTAAGLLAPTLSPEELVGRSLTELGPDLDTVRDRNRIVGVVEDAREEGLDRAAPPMVYHPYLQSRPFGRMWVIARHQGPSVTAFADVRAAMAEIDEELPLVDADRFSDRVLRSVAGRRFNLYLLGTMATVALLLALVGSVGLVGFTLARRRREMGIRIALGATGSDVRSRLMVGVLGPLGVGTAIGALAAHLGSRAVQSVAFGVGTLGWIDIGLAGAILLISATLCALLASRRAGAVSPRSVLSQG